MKLGDISVNFAKQVFSTLNDLGCEPEELQQQFALNDSKLNQPDGRISIPRFMRLGHGAIQLSQRPDFGIEMGKRVTIPLQGLAGLLALTAENLQQACEVLVHYEALSSTNSRGKSHFYLNDDGHGVSEFYSISPYNEFNRFVVDVALVGRWRMLELISGKTGAVKLLEIEYPEPTYAQLFEDLLGCRVIFGADRNALTVRREALAWTLPQSDHNTFASLAQVCDEKLGEVTRQRKFSEQVMDEISPLLTGRTPSIEEVAQNMGLPPWTLRRKLATDQTTFQQILNDTRRGLAESYMKDTGLTISEVSYLLGFGSPTAFQRAFKRWTGQAPGQYRTSLKSE